MTGVSLLELIVVMGIAAILLGVAATSYQGITTSSRMSGEINGLLADLQFGRSEAIKQGQNVVICVSTSGSDCTAGTSWNQGWIVFVDPTNAHSTGGNAALVLRAQPAFTSQDTLTDGATSLISFDRDGLALGLLTSGGAVIPLHDSTHNATRTRCLQITNVGNVSVQQPTTLAACT